MRRTILKTITSAFLSAFFFLGFGQSDPSLKMRFFYDKLSSGNGLIVDAFGDSATVQNNATTRQMGDFTVLDLGKSNGYLDLSEKAGNIIAGLYDFSISTYVCIDSLTDLSPNGNFLWSFANSSDAATTANGQMFFSAKSTRYAISQTNWSGESGFDNAKALTKGSWQHVTYTQSGTIGSIYINGSLVKSGTINLLPKNLGATKFNFIGKSPYAGDTYLLNALFYDFRIYNKQLTANEVAALDDSLKALNKAYNLDILETEKNSFVIPNLNNINANISLPSKTANGISISWTSSNPDVISTNGIVVRPAIGQVAVNVDLTAEFSKNGFSTTKVFKATVLPAFDDKNSVKNDSTNLILEGNLSNLRSNVKLPVLGYEGSSISWASNNTNYIANDGTLLKVSPKGSKIKVSLTATITKGTATTKKTFDISIAEDEGFSAYLFVYFTGNAKSEEQIRFALSSDGFSYKALNENVPVINSADISLTGGVRDPHIYRGLDSTFYMVATDMVSANGWDSNRGIVLLKSKNLVDWTSATVNIPTAFPNEFADITRAWAPQSIYDNVAKKMIVYFSLKKPNGPDIIYYSYANKDFTALETTPKQLFFSPNNFACIDADILYKDSIYTMFFKTEGSGNGIKKATSKNLTEGYVMYDKYLDQSDSPVEGAGSFKLINSDTYILMYDVYTSGKYEFTQSTDLTNFSVVKETVSMDFTPRHGTIMPITKEEAEALVKKWGKSSDLNIQSAKSKFVKRNNIVINTSAKTIYLPVKKGTKLDALDPEFLLTPGVQITPSTPQDFTKGAVDYTVSIESLGSKTFSVTAEVNNNPILPGFYADPEVLYSKKTGKYYIYPTSDGFTGWSGNYFKVFSSENLIDWTDEGVILNLPTDVKWGTTNSWAPTIIEKEVDGEYKYYFYFCAAQKIGVAVADNPTGPFIDHGRAIISSLPSGASGQQIDPDVFFDPASETNYLFWGNGYMARAELNDDMVSINTNSIKVITPDNTFREGTEVFFREGKYYFLWSEDDTRSPNYKVRYGYSDSPTGTLTIPKNNIVIARNDSLGIYGTGHNCVLHVQDSDKYYIIYHRFTRPKGITMGDAAGYNREVCMDELMFNEDGTIKQVTPTLKGIGADSVKIIDAVFNKKYSSSIKVYPNPGKFAINISTTEKLVKNSTVVVFDSTGRKMFEKSLGSSDSQIDISSLSSGFYILELSKMHEKIGSCRFLVK